MAEREKWVDSAKAIAIILVILGHVSGDLTGWFNFKFVYGFHLVIFYIISGYFTKQRPLTLDFVTKKFRRLMVPYFLTCFVIMLLDSFNLFFISKVRSYASITEVIAKDLTRSFYASGDYSHFGEMEMGGRIGAIWFLPALFFSVIIFQLLVGYISDNRILGLVCVLLSLLGYFTARFIWLPFSFQAGLFTVFFLWIGYTVKKYNLLKRLKWYYCLIGLFVLLVGIYFDVCVIYFVDAYARDLLLSIIVGLAGGLVVYGVGKLTEKSRFLRWLGQNSMTVLCIHLISLETLGTYYGKVLNKIGLEGNGWVWGRICLELIVTILGTFLLQLVREKIYQPIKNNIISQKQKRALSQGTAGKVRSSEVDIARGMLILSMLIGHFEINPVLRNVIYSCHMIAFVFLSGYFYKQGESVGKVFKRMLKTFLLPYLICFLCNILLDIPQWSGAYFVEIIKTYVFGMSFSRRLLPNVASVGPVYFILMLFVVRLLYKIIDTIVKNEKVKWVVIAVFFVIGIVLGRKEFWLPWSIDVAFYSLLFYQFGITFRKYRLTALMVDNPWLYFLLSPIWFFMIHKGGMEIAVRHYEDYGLVIAGALSGILLIYCLSAYIAKTTVFFSPVLNFIGRASIVIIIVHVLLNSRLNRFLGNYMGQDGFALMFVSIIVQVALACIIYFLISKVKKLKFKKLQEAA